MKLLSKRFKHLKVLSISTELWNSATPFPQFNLTQQPTWGESIKNASRFLWNFLHFPWSNNANGGGAFGCRIAVASGSCRTCGPLERKLWIACRANPKRAIVNRAGRAQASNWTWRLQSSEMASGRKLFLLLNAFWKQPFWGIQFL